MNWVQFGQGAAEPISSREMVCFLWRLRSHSEDAIAEDDLMEGRDLGFSEGSFTRMSGCWLRRQLEWSVRTSTRGLPGSPGLPHKMVLVERERPGDGERKKKKRERENRWKVCHLF